ncbi:MAG TPA: hypothetical protein VG276_21590 [Actinomycetes bacterium]|jgi:hypothetical protein|nr:hypothetical protein [Actinomycetes bacterium]
MQTLLRRFRAATLGAATFCDRCAEVCDARCRSQATIDHARAQTTAHRVGL